MSKLIVPSYLKGNVKKAKEKKKEEDKGPALERVPQAIGWRMVVLPYKGVEKTKGGLLLTDKAIEEQQLTTNVGLILSMGSDAYADKNKFPNGPWCEKGDWIVFARYAGSRVRIEGGEVRILNDDEVLAKLKDPKDVLNIY
jgi:co-chaperonin GroES (HSP10)|tara:strand:- start:36 stop:458 length:423 start_codon:yes stop_codon:yes gene_type:complete